jgi:predicted nuclease of predicted toxin-antitoxin system
MKILIDECLPKKLKQEFSDHDASTVPEIGWAGKKNGELLRLMSGTIDVFVTIDQNLKYQQQLAGSNIAFIILIAPNNTLDSLKPLMPAVLNALGVIQPGQVIEISS